MVHQGTTLSEALKNIRGDFLFWQREVYEHLNRAPEKGTPSQVTGGHSGCHLVSDRITGNQCESAHSGGEPTPPEPQRKGDPEVRIRPARGVPRAGRTVRASSKPRAMTGGSDKGHTETRGGASPTFPWMQDTPERLRLRLRWTPRPVPESSKPSLILLYAGKDDAGALDAYLHAYNPAFSEYIWAVDIRRNVEILAGHAGRRALLYDVLHGHGHGGQGRLCGGRPQLQDVEHSQMVPQTGRPAAGEGQGGADPVGLEGLEPPGNGGHGQRQRAHAPTDVPDLAGLAPPSWSTQWTNGVQQVLIDLGHTGLHSMGERTPPLPHQV